MVTLNRLSRICCIFMLLIGLLMPAHFAASAPVMAEETASNTKPPIAPRSMQGIADHGFDAANPMAFVRSLNSRTFSHMVTDRQGALHSIFYDQDAGNLMYLGSPDIEVGNTGAATVITSIPPIGRGKYPRIAVDDGGAVHVIWIENIYEANGDHDHMRYAWCEINCTDSHSWQEQADSLPMDVPLFCELTHPSIVAWGSGSQRRIGADPVLQYRQWIDGRDGQGMWSPPVELYTGVVGNLMHEGWAAHFVNLYGITVDAAGHVHVAFPLRQDYNDNSPQEPWHMSCENGCGMIANWTTPVSIVEQATQCDMSNAPNTMNNTIRLAAAPDGKVYALWKRLNNSDKTLATEVEIYTATYLNGQWGSV